MSPKLSDYLRRMSPSVRARNEHLQAETEQTPGIVRALTQLRGESVTMTLTKALESKNVRDGWHPFRKGRERQDWLEAIVAEYGYAEPPEYLQRLTLTRYIGHGQRGWDANNMAAGSVTELQDALVHAGYLKDDAPRYLLETVCEQVREAGKSGTCVRLERVK